MDQVFWNEGTDDNTSGCIEFPKLKEVRLRNLPYCQGLENIIIKFPSLTEMEIERLPKLNSINSKDVSFCNLKSVDIRDCDNLRYLFLVTPAGRCLLQLEVLGIEYCMSMEQVFWNEGTDDNTDGCIDCIEFPNLKRLTLSNWNEGTDDNTDGCIEFPKLKRLTLSNLPNLTAFCQGLENINIKFPNLTEMGIEYLPKLNSFNLKDVYFCNLKSVVIRNCDNLRYLFLVTPAGRCLLQLEVLRIEDCKSMEQVFWNEGTDDNTSGCIEFPKLKQLTLVRLPKLNSFNSKDVSFCNLKSIYIRDCDNLTYLFSVSTARRSFLQLEFLEIRCCDSMDQVFWNEATYTSGCIEFPKLKEVRLWYLPNCQGLENIIIKFPRLTEMKIVGLPKLNSINSKVRLAGRCLLQLEVLEIEDCKSMEQVFWNEGTDDNTDGCIEFPKLKRLTLENLPNLTAFCQGLENIIIKFPNLTEMRIEALPKLNSIFPPSSETLENTRFHLFCNLKDVSFCNLKFVYISECYNLRYFFSVSVSAVRRCLLQLEVLEIQYCESMEQVFWNEGTYDNTNGCIEFPKLKELSLKHLPNMTAFCQGLENISIKFPNLTRMKIQDLPMLNSIVPLNAKARSCHLQLEELEIDGNADGCIEFPKLKDLMLCNLPNLTTFCQGLESIIIKFPNLTDMHISTLPKLTSLPLNSKDGSFCNLKSISIWKCHNLRHVLSASVARTSLLQLEILKIKKCQSMEQVLCNEIKDGNTDDCIEFPKLKELTLVNLPNLTAFCQGLENIIIKCPNLTQRMDMDIKHLPKLSSLFLFAIQRFWQWNHALELPMLEEMMEKDFCKLQNDRGSQRLE